jgi:protein-disulfide isomerase
MSDAKSANAKKDSDVIQIPIGNYVKNLRNNLWMISTLVLAVVVILLIFFKSSGVTGSVISSDEAGQKVVSFINAQGQGSAELVSSEKQGSLYQVKVNYNGQEIPVYVTLDGEYLTTSLIPLSGSANSGTDTGTDNSEPVEVTLGDSPVLGKADAPVTIIEFSDFQCPFCGKFFSETFPDLKKNYIDTGKAKLVYKDFPLSFHPEAEKAAEAASCVREQKQDVGFWKMHDKMFANQETLSVANEKAWARQLGVDGAKFDKCLDDGKYKSAVQEDEAYGQQLGVSGTPTFFINGRELVGAQPYSAFQKIIDEELAKQA